MMVFFGSLFLCPYKYFDLFKIRIKKAVAKENANMLVNTIIGVKMS